MVVPEGTGSGALPLQTGTADIIFGAANIPAAAGEAVANGFVGAMEELGFHRLSLENVTAHLFSEPGSGCTNYYIWDYTNPEARAHWAKSIAGVYNVVQPVASQWDGAEFQEVLSPWGLPHSRHTVSSQQSQYFRRAGMVAFEASHTLWKEPVAVEFSFTSGGLGPWPGDMTPFADEGRIKGKDLCSAGDGWHQHMLQDMLLSGTTYNSVSGLPCNVRREGGQSLVIGGSSLVILEGKACNPL